MKRRVYDQVLKHHLSKYNQMIFLVGPRRVGKTTTSHECSKGTTSLYLNWDNPEDRDRIMRGYPALIKDFNLVNPSTKPIIIFDEIHKYSEWRSYIKGFYDYYHQHLKIIVTGSAMLELFNSCGESMMGRYFLYHMHPLSLLEAAELSLARGDINKQVSIDSRILDDLLMYGGFPEPYFLRDKTFLQQWQSMRHQQIFSGDLLTLSNIREIANIEKLARLLREQAGHTTSYASLAQKIGVSATTIKRWISSLNGLYYSFEVRPWSKNITRSLIKEPKYYLWDWSLVPDRGTRIENLVASHLRKAVQLWTDAGQGEYDLYYLRDRQKREVDFLVTKNRNPWFLVEVKTSQKQEISPSVHYFQKRTGAPHAFQVAFDAPFQDYDCFSFSEPTKVAARTFLSQLV